jgi:O-antigen ligase
MARPQDGVTTSLYLRAAPGAPEARLRFLARTDGAEAAATVGTTASWRREVLSIDGGPHRRVSVVLFNPGPEDVDACVTGVQVEPGAEPGRYVNLVSAARDLRRSGGTPLLALGATAAMLYGLVAIVAAARALSLAARLPLARLVVWLSLGLAVHLVLVAIEVLVDPGRARGLTTHPNVLGTYAGLAAVLLATAHRGPPWRTVGLVAAVLLVLASQSRLAALGLGLVLVVALGRARGRRAAWIGAALALLMVGVVVLARGLSPDWWAATGRPAIFAAAVEAWATSVRSFLFGWGGGGATIGMALAMWPDGTRYFAHAHNGLLQLVIHGGLAGAAGVVVAAVAVVRRALTVRAADAAVAGFLAVTLVADLTVVGSPVYVLVLAYVGARSAERSSYPR